MEPLRAITACVNSLRGINPGVCSKWGITALYHCGREVFAWPRCVVPPQAYDQCVEALRAITAGVNSWTGFGMIFHGF